MAKRIQGITQLGKGKVRVRARWTDPRTKRSYERDRVLKDATDAEALMEKKRLVEEMKRGLGGIVREVKLRDYAISWLRGQWMTLCPSTRDRYVATLDDHVFPRLGDLLIDEIARQDIERFRDEQRKKYAAATVNGHLRVLRAVLNDAAADREWRSSPAARVKSLPEDDSRVSLEEPNALTCEELKRFLQAALKHQPKYYGMIATLATTGMRPSALRALQWKDIDQEAGTITVRRRVSGNEVVQGVKRSRRGYDIVPLMPELWSILQSHKERFNEAQIESGLVFPSQKGKILDRSILRRPFDDILERAGISKRFTPHGLRRTANDMYRQATSEVVTRSITGHTTHRMHEHYSSVNAAEKVAAANRAFGGLLDRPMKGAGHLRLVG